MCVRLMGHVFDSQLPVTHRIVALAMANCANPDGGNIYPTVKRLASDCGLSNRHVRRVLSDLRRAGIIIETAPSTGSGPVKYKMDKVALLGWSPDGKSPLTDTVLSDDSETGLPSDQLSSPDDILSGGDIFSQTVNEPSKENQEYNRQRACAPREDPEFKEFYASYPNKKSPDLAARSFRKARKRATFEQIMNGLSAAKDDWAARRTEKQFIPHPSTWLNDGRWDDDHTNSPAPGGFLNKKTIFDTLPGEDDQ